MFAEDTPDIAVFNYLKKGFRRQPTDYYLRPFYVEAEKVIGFNKPGNCILCLGSRLSLSVLLNYATKHTLTWDQRRKFFGFFWSTSYTHDSFNLNPEGDAAVLEFLKRYRSSRVANNTILMLISDHGLRWGSFRETYQGRLEERLPLLMFVLPNWFKRQYGRAVDNLRRNGAMLTTHYDLHDTLYDLADLQRLDNDTIPTRTIDRSARSQSLFLPVDANRTCQRAGIPSTYCTCRDKVRTLQPKDRRYLKAAEALLEHINRLIKYARECAQLSIDRLESGSIESSSMGDSLKQGDDSTSHIVVTMRLKPGNGLFEGTLTYHKDTSSYVVVGPVSRINEYGSQSFCVDDAKMKLYCFCRQ